MLATAALVLSSCFTIALGTDNHTNITITTAQPWDAEDLIQQDKMFVSVNTTITGRPRNCQDLIQQGETYDGYYVVYTEASAPNKASMIYCSQDDGMEALPSDMANSEPARNCLDLLQDGITTSGPNIIYPYWDHPAEPVLVSCNQETDGGGWTVIQERFDGSEDFYRDWDAYLVGFGNVGFGKLEHYLGNDKIAAITEVGVNELRVELEDWEGITAFAHYKSFRVDAYNTYQLQVSSYDGTAGDSLAVHNLRAFSTFDADHDTWSANCAVLYHGAWWYVDCLNSNLNGRYYPSADTGGAYDGMRWWAFRGSDSLKSSTMMVRPYSAVAAHTEGLHGTREAATH